MRGKGVREMRNMNNRDLRKKLEDQNMMIKCSRPRQICAGQTHIVTP